MAANIKAQAESAVNSLTHATRLPHDFVDVLVKNPEALAAAEKLLDFLRRAGALEDA